MRLPRGVGSRGPGRDGGNPELTRWPYGGTEVPKEFADEAARAPARKSLSSLRTDGERPRVRAALASPASLPPNPSPPTPTPSVS